MRRPLSLALMLGLLSFPAVGLMGCGAESKRETTETVSTPGGTTTTTAPASHTGNTESGEATWYDAPAGTCAHKTIAKGTIVTGDVLLDGEDVLTMQPGRLRAVRWTDMAIVFQGALHSLNPVQRVGRQIGEAVLRLEDAAYLLQSY